MSQYTVHLKIELSDDHGFEFNKELFKYILSLDLDESHLTDAFHVENIEIESVDGIVQPFAFNGVQ